MNNLLSYSSAKLDLFAKDGVHLKTASGFVMEAGNRYYLITNRHVVCDGDIPADGQPESIPKPYLLKTSIHFHSGEGEKCFPFEAARRQKVTIQLYGKDDTPNWLECQAKWQQQIPDVVALPIELTATQTIIQSLKLFGKRELANDLYTSGWLKTPDYWSRISATSVSAIDTDVDYAPPDTVHVIGYPLGWAPEGTDRSSSAFWRTGSIASEVYENWTTRADTFFIDPCAPEGMSGSPVVGMKNDRVKLLGVYSDCSTAEFGANAGLVWDARLVKKLIGIS